MELITFLQSSTLAFTLLAALLGLFIGSFLNVVVVRVPKMMERSWRQECLELLGTDHGQSSAEPPFNLWTPRSQCPHCTRQVKASENIPLLSYLLLRGKCRGCGKSISAQYPLIEILTAIMSAYVAYYFGYGWMTAFALIFTWSLISLAMIDANTTLLPDSITLPILWLGIIANYFGLFCDLQSSILGAIFGYLSLWLVFQIFRLITGKEGMGYGDFKLLALLGAWLGWQQLLPIILISSVSGAVIGIVLLSLRNLGRETPLPFGPYLAVGGWISMFWGTTIASILGF